MRRDPFKLPNLNVMIWKTSVYSEEVKTYLVYVSYKPGLTSDESFTEGNIQEIGHHLQG